MLYILIHRGHRDLFAFFSVRWVAKTHNWQLPTILRIAVSCQWTFPRAKNCSPALNFCTSVPTGAALSSPCAPAKKDHTFRCGLFWQGHKDLNLHHLVHSRLKTHKTMRFKLFSYYCGLLDTITKNAQKGENKGTKTPLPGPTSKEGCNYLTITFS